MTLCNLRQEGFTLIEIIIALVVISVALGAVINTVGSSVSHGSHLKEKTLGLWVAQNYLAEVSITQQWPTTGQKSDQVMMAGKQWYIQNKVTQTPDKLMRRLDVSVFSDREYEQKLASLVAFVTRPQAVTRSGDGNDDTLLETRQ